jgi:hypothetical protein
MGEWAKTKGRMDKEIMRKFESSKYGNQFREESMKDRDGKSEDLIDIEKVEEAVFSIRLDGGKASKEDRIRN